MGPVFLMLLPCSTCYGEVSDKFVKLAISYGLVANKLAT